MENIIINTDYITLGQFLKLISKISSGGEAKFYLVMNDVFVNNIKEERRGKKIYSGDIVRINSIEYKVESNEA